MPSQTFALDQIDPRREDWTRWAQHHAVDLAGLVRAAAVPTGGFGFLDAHNRRDEQQPVATWLTARMTHVSVLATLSGQAQSADLVDIGVRGLTGPLRDDRNGGWFASTADRNAKEAYPHAFVVLAAASAAGAGHPEGQALLADALTVVEDHFWDDDAGLVRESWDPTWTTLDSYRGVNANMHTVEAFLAAWQVTGDRRWLDRAATITDRVVHGFAAEHAWRLPEHFDSSWQVELDYNRDKPGDQFRPYGVTIGHLLEWARLALHVRTALGDSAPAYLLTDAAAMYQAAVARGWDVDGAPGFVYTTDFEDRPVVRERMHWVVAEAIGTAWTLWRDTGDERYVSDHARWWDYALRYLVDPENGSWQHELDAQNRPSALVWPGRPDVYHAYQATVLPLWPQAPSFIGAALQL
ncbi:AGE family epimerase/isomerase [Dermacoccaceae bacterium W4C1]